MTGNREQLPRCQGTVKNVEGLGGIRFDDVSEPVFST